VTRRWTLGWALWLAALLALEIAAALHSGAPGPQTLSEHLWIWFSWWGGWIVLLIGLGYLTWHLVRGARRRSQTRRKD
jgi:hypothetical protein